MLGGFGVKIRRYARRARIGDSLPKLDECAPFMQTPENNSTRKVRAVSGSDTVLGGWRRCPIKQQKLPVAIKLPAPVGAIRANPYQRTSVPTECEQMP